MSRRVRGIGHASLSTEFKPANRKANSVTSEIQRNIRNTLGRLDSGLKVKDIIAELHAERERWGCPLIPANRDDYIAILNMLGAFK